MLVRTPIPDLPALPERTAPYPEHVPLDHGEVASALWHGKGNLHEAARMLHTTPGRLGAVVRRTPALAEIRSQAAELLLDKAEETLLTALDSPDPVRSDSTARFILEKGGRSRGWTRDGSQGVAMSFGSEARAGVVAVRWETES